MADIILKMSVFDPLQQSEWLGARRYWIGLTDLAAEGEWRWFDTGELLNYTNYWYAGQPDHIAEQPNLSHWVRGVTSKGIRESKNYDIALCASAECLFNLKTKARYFK
jgi:hypothetical protein